MAVAAAAPCAAVAAARMALFIVKRGSNYILEEKKVGREVRLRK